MQIELSKEQYETLLKLVYLGNWVANSSRIDDKLENYEKVEDHIFSFAKEFGFPEFVDDEETDKGKFYPTRMFEEDTEVNKLVDDYDNETFWQELPHRLGDRDFVREYGEDKIKEMSREERFSKNYEFIDKWQEELEDNGINRLDVKK
ncbi:MAG: hypothetical protein AAB969_01825 [Patescibacteria group bacterium]